MGRPSILEVTRPQLAESLAAWNEPAFRLAQVWQGIYRQGANSAKSITGLPKSLRLRLDETYAFRGLEVRREARSHDGSTVKVALGRPGDPRSVEAVRMGYRNRTTLCISTQSGCAMGCTFCATGQMGFAGQLTAGEMVEQVLHFAARERISNIVFMGMGEPFHNYDATLEAVDRLNDAEGMAFGARRMTLSTVGLVPQIERFTQERRQVNLAVSLHGATDEVRDRLVPINRKYPLDILLQACREYVRHTGRRLTFEWALIRDINDGEEQARALAARVHGLNCHVNLIPLNPTAGYPGEASPRQRAAAFRSVLTAQGIPCTVRVRRGLDIDAGCGQLATRISGQWSVVSGQWSVVSGQWSVVSGQWSVVSGQWSVVSGVSPLMSLRGHGPWSPKRLRSVPEGSGAGGAEAISSLRSMVSTRGTGAIGEMRWPPHASLWAGAAFRRRAMTTRRSGPAP